MTTDGGDRFLGAPRFDVVLRGYDRRQVDEHLARLQRIIARMRADLEIARSQQAPPPPPITPGRGFPGQGPRPQPGAAPWPAPQYRPPGPGPDVVGGFTDRMQSILRAAEEEAAEIRRQAHASTGGDDRLRAQVADLVGERDAVLGELNRMRGQLEGLISDPAARPPAPLRPVPATGELPLSAADASAQPAAMPPAPSMNDSSTPPPGLPLPPSTDDEPASPAASPVQPLIPSNDGEPVTPPRDEPASPAASAPAPQPGAVEPTVPHLGEVAAAAPSPPTTRTPGLRPSPLPRRTSVPPQPGGPPTGGRPPLPGTPLPPRPASAPAPAARAGSVPSGAYPAHDERAAVHGPSRPVADQPVPRTFRPVGGHAEAGADNEAAPGSLFRPRPPADGDIERTVAVSAVRPTPAPRPVEPAAAEPDSGSTEETVQVQAVSPVEGSPSADEVEATGSAPVAQAEIEPQHDHVDDEQDAAATTQESVEPEEPDSSASDTSTGNGTGNGATHGSSNNGASRPTSAFRSG